MTNIRKNTTDTDKKRIIGQLGRQPFRLHFHRKRIIFYNHLRVVTTNIHKILSEQFLTAEETQPSNDEHQPKASKAVKTGALPALPPFLKYDWLPHQPYPFMDPPHPIGQPRIRPHCPFKIQRSIPFRLIFGPYSTSQWTLRMSWLSLTHCAYSSNESVYVWWLTWWVRPTADGADGEWGLGRCVLDVFHNLPLLLVSSSTSSIDYHLLLWWLVCVVCEVLWIMVFRVTTIVSGECGCGGGMEWMRLSDGSERMPPWWGEPCLPPPPLLLLVYCCLDGYSRMDGWIDYYCKVVVGITIWLFLQSYGVLAVYL